MCRPSPVQRALCRAGRGHLVASLAAFAAFAALVGATESALVMHECPRAKSLAVVAFADKLDIVLPGFCSFQVPASELTSLPCLGLGQHQVGFVDRAARSCPGNPRRAALDLPAHSSAMGQNSGAKRAVAVGLQPQPINPAGSKIHRSPNH